MYCIIITTLLTCLIYVTVAQDVSVSNYDIVPEIYAAPTPPSSEINTTYTLNITAEFGPLANKKPYSFFGNLSIPLLRFGKPSLPLSIKKVLFKNGVTLLRTAHLGQGAMEGLFLKLNVSYEPQVKNPDTKAINIKQIIFNEEIRTVNVTGKRITTTIATWSRYFIPYGMNGTIIYPNGTEFGESYEDFVLQIYSTGGGYTNYASIVLILPPMLIISLANLFRD